MSTSPKFEVTVDEKTGVETATLVSGKTASPKKSSKKTKEEADSSSDSN